MNAKGWSRARAQGAMSRREELALVEPDGEERRNARGRDRQQTARPHAGSSIDATLPVRWGDWRGTFQALPNVAHARQLDGPASTIAKRRNQPDHRADFTEAADVARVQAS